MCVTALENVINRFRPGYEKIGTRYKYTLYLVQFLFRRSKFVLLILIRDIAQVILLTLHN